jgi:hypothetical protein
MRNLQYRQGSTGYLFSKAAPVSEDARFAEPWPVALDAATTHPVTVQTGEIANLSLNVTPSF